MDESKTSVDSAPSNLIYYDSAAKYWSKIPPTVEGMLGGFGFISRTDVKGSQTFLKHVFTMKNPPGRSRAADCGAGIGRVTKNLLIKFFKQVDLIEQNNAFLEEAKSFIGSCKNTVKCINVGLQDFSPELNTYDVIWSQWVLGHLTDKDLVGFFKSCKHGLKPNGVIIVKENLTSSNTVEVDDEDSSVTRPLHLLQDLYKEAGLHCIREEKQTNFPKGIYQVRMFALRPALDSDNSKTASLISKAEVETPTNLDCMSSSTDSESEGKSTDVHKTISDSVFIKGNETEPNCKPEFSAQPSEAMEQGDQYNS